MKKIEDILEGVERCDECHKDYDFYQRQFPVMFHRCQICSRNLCPVCWGHKHLFAWKFCAACKPEMDCDQAVPTN